MHFIEKVLSREEFVQNPPVLVDIGASGAVNPKWQPIAKFSICLAFDADDRDFNSIVSESSTYKKLYTYNSIVADESSASVDFYLTRSPHCSSLLEPDNNQLKGWAFAELFEVGKVVKLKATSLRSVLDDLGITKIDWFKTDSQGIDLRLFKSIGEEAISQTLVADFEPGIIDAYKGEDKLYSLMSYMQTKPFWMSNIRIRGSQKVSASTLEKHLSAFEQKHLDRLMRTSPGWGEVTYFNSFSLEQFDKRDFLLGWVFSILETQYGFALELIDTASQRFNDPIFDELRLFTLARIKSGYINILGFYTIKFLSKFKKLVGQ